MRPSQPLLAIDPQTKANDTSTGLLLLRDLLCWPFQWLTYATLLYASAHVLLTLIAYLAVVPVVLLALCLVPYAVLRSLACVAIQRSGRLLYPWRVLYACTRPLVVADVRLHNQFAPSSKTITLAYDMSVRQSASRGYRPLFVVRMVDVRTPMALIKTWAYLLLGRAVLCVPLGYFWGSTLWDVAESAIELAVMALQWRWDDFEFCFGWGKSVSCVDHPFGCVGVYVLECLLVVVLRAPLVKLLSWGTRCVSSESVLVLNHDPMMPV
ncbi:hypothetical protein SPRG_14308 [Saprolegnia parasitica CBS 223.65]|uniref:Uncharacterized protein n=1 Tax=Saprolegnia parasitica (strain CBS 223.65) TaxID=695850 RepID=A0A067C1K0_SAPPC|nr:hypothetical protein SPRG_14308 [Saprolegnia parasitica CBS 223.65]KDO20436.1 hypothetical protein SPRG_14308 [Saprolegnia parasitica CBS 223.65]|eukprot:XP_012208826.1 hypothetical protein SPRG_14308 [Saprolegnia parasitica CBS 223.65]